MIANASKLCEYPHLLYDRIQQPQLQIIIVKQKNVCLKKSLKIVSFEKNLANEDSDFGSMFLELLFEPGKFATD